MNARIYTTHLGHNLNFSFLSSAVGVIALNLNLIKIKYIPN